MRILVYGDSNSWGYLDDGSGVRFAGRWPVSMASALTAAGQDVELIEECLPGRTTNVDDPQEGAWCNGLTPFEAILLSQQPLDRILIMLGTNDLKHRFGRDASTVTAGLMALVSIATKTVAPFGSVGAVRHSPIWTDFCASVQSLARSGRRFHRPGGSVRPRDGVPHPCPTGG